MLARPRPYPSFKKPPVSAQELWLHKVPFRRKQKELSSNSLRKLKSKLQRQSERISKKKTPTVLLLFKYLTFTQTLQRTSDIASSQQNSNKALPSHLILYAVCMGMSACFLFRLENKHVQACPVVTTPHNCLGLNIADNLSPTAVTTCFTYQSAKRRC